MGMSRNDRAKLERVKRKIESSRWAVNELSNLFAHYFGLLDDLDDIGTGMSAIDSALSKLEHLAGGGA